jgi:hypothetical protein
MIMAHDITPRLDDLAGMRAAFVLVFSIMTLRQVECHVR